MEAPGRHFGVEMEGSSTLTCTSVHGWDVWVYKTLVNLKHHKRWLQARGGIPWEGSTAVTCSGGLSCLASSVSFPISSGWSSDSTHGMRCVLWSYHQVLVIRWVPTTLALKGQPPYQSLCFKRHPWNLLEIIKTNIFSKSMLKKMTWLMSPIIILHKILLISILAASKIQPWASLDPPVELSWHCHDLVISFIKSTIFCSTKLYINALKNLEKKKFLQMNYFQGRKRGAGAKNRL